MSLEVTFEQSQTGKRPLYINIGGTLLGPYHDVSNLAQDLEVLRRWEGFDAEKFKKIIKSQCRKFGLSVIDYGNSMAIQDQNGVDKGYITIDTDKNIAVVENSAGLVGIYPLTEAGAKEAAHLLFSDLSELV